VDGVLIDECICSGPMHYYDSLHDPLYNGVVDRLFQTPAAAAEEAARKQYLASFENRLVRLEEGLRSKGHVSKQAQADLSFVLAGYHRMFGETFTSFFDHRVERLLDPRICLDDETYDPDQSLQTFLATYVPDVPYYSRMDGSLITPVVSVVGDDDDDVTTDEPGIVVEERKTSSFPRFPSPPPNSRPRLERSGSSGLGPLAPSSYGVRESAVRSLFSADHVPRPRPTAADLHAMMSSNKRVGQ
jgi:hypothetical protein